MVDFNIRVVLDTQEARRGTEETRSQLDRLNQSAERTQRLMRRAFEFAGLTLGIRELVRLNDTFTNVENRLAVVTNSTRELTDVQERLFRIARETRSSFEATAILYGRVAIASQNLGRSQEELLRFTELVNKATVASGASASEAHAGLIQLAQGIASNRLQGDELRSVLENLLGVQKALAAGLGVTSEKLREMAAAGELTANQIIQAILNQEQQINALFDKTSITIGQALQQLDNAATRVIGLSNQATGATALLGQGILEVADHLGGILAGSIAALAVTQLPLLVSGFRAAAAGAGTLSVAMQLLAVRGGAAIVAMSALRGILAFLASPLGVGLAVFAIIELSRGTDYAAEAAESYETVLRRMRSQITGATRELKALNDEQKALALSEVRSAIIDQGQAFDQGLTAFRRSTLRGLTNASDFADPAFQEGFKQVGQLRQQFIEGAITVQTFRAEILELAGDEDSPLRRLVDALVRESEAAATAQKEIDILAARQRELLGVATDADIALLNEARGIRDVGTTTRDASEEIEELIQKTQLKLDLAKELNLTDEIGVKILNLLVEAGANANDVDRERIAVLRGLLQAESDLFQKQQSRLEILAGSGDPRARALLRRSEASNGPLGALAAGGDSDARAALNRIFRETQDQIDPVGASLAGLQEQARLLKLSNDERRIEVAFRQEIDNLRRNGATEEEIDAARERIRLQITENDILQQTNEQMEEARRRAEQFGQSLNQAFQNAILNGENLIDVMGRLLLQAALFGIDGKSGLFGGTLFKLASGIANFTSGFSLSSFFHGGGVVGRDTTATALVPTALFADAPRFHSGRFPGFGADEFPAILQRDETVLTPGQLAAMAGARGATVNVTVNAPPGTQAEVRRRETPDGTDLEIFILQVAGNSLARGDLGEIVDNRFGVTPRPI